MGPLEHPHPFSVLTVIVWDRLNTLTLLVYLQLCYGASGTTSHFLCAYRYGMGPLRHAHTFSVLRVMLWDRWNTLTLLVYLQLCYGTAGTPSYY
jgi:hypothetical protein